MPTPSTYLLHLSALCYLVAVQGMEIDPPEDEFTIPAGATFTISCSHDKPVKWLHPRQLMIGSSDVDNVIVDGYNLTIMGASYLNVGLYSCESMEEPKEEKSMYLFVKDINHLLVAENHNVIDFPADEEIIVPCKPSFPEVNVSLTAEADFEIVQSIPDPKKGISVEAQNGETLPLICTGVWEGRWSEVTYEVHKEHHPDHLPIPKIIVTGASNKHILEGQDITLKCEATVPIAVKFSLVWEKPHENDVSRITEGQFSNRAKEGDYSYVVGTKTLTIHNVSKRDEGNYTCYSSNQKGKKPSVYRLKVFGSTEEFLNLSIAGPQNVEVKLADYHRETTFTAAISAYPDPKVSWFHEARELKASDKITIATTEFSSQLTIRHPHTLDSGTYIMKAVNSAGSKQLSFSLNVEGEPTPSFISVPHAYFLNSSGTVTCNVVGYPKPIVNVTFTPCTEDSQFCPISGLRTLKNVETCRMFSCNHNVSMTFRKHGWLSCSADNKFGRMTSRVFINVTDIPNEFHVYNASVGNGEISDVDSIVLKCGASKLMYKNEFEWHVKKPNSSSSEIIREKLPGTRIVNSLSPLSYFSTLTIVKAQLNNSGSYTCKVREIDSMPPYDQRSSLPTKITVQRYVRPHFIDSSNGTVMFYSEGATPQLSCDAVGFPEPTITWYKDGRLIVADGKKIVLNYGNRQLLIHNFTAKDSGVYKCSAQIYDASTTLLFIVKESSLIGTVQWAIIGIFVIVVMICIFALLYQRKRMKKKVRDYEGRSILPSFPMLDPFRDISEQVDQLPYDASQWEFPAEKLKFGKQLGTGAFGIVLKAEAIGIINDDEKTTVAVKRPKQSSDEAILALQSELKIMDHIGHHVNVVNLLGACTKNLQSRELLVIVEYCKYGNIHDFLQRHRDRFINQVNPGSGNLENVTSDGMGYDVGTTRSNSNYNGGSIYSTGNSNCPTVYTDMTSVSTPIGDDGYLVSRSMNQNYQGDSTERKTVRTQDLLCWGFQIAKGMEYLAQRKVVHSDLAARNVLLAEDNVVKICDFGLAKNMYIYEIDVFKRDDKARLPIKWMSVEAIEDRVFSIQSDVWAYGIVLWELFTLAKTPYPDIQPVDLLRYLKDGHRMKKPEYATEDVYNLMQECWQAGPMLRPSFEECAERVGNMLEESVKQHYVDLNNPYVEFNNEHYKGREYLNMLRPPTYENIISKGHRNDDDPPVERDHRYNRDEEKESVELQTMLPKPDT